jgi:hypothetical protein
LGFNAEFTLRDYTFDGYWGFALVGGELKDEIELIGDNEQPILLNLRRKVIAARGSIGLSFPINQYIKLRPYLTAVLSDLRSNSNFEGLPDPLQTNTFQSSASMISTVGSFDALFSRWYKKYRLEFKAQYNFIYTDSFSDDNTVLDTHDLNDTLRIEGKFSGPTKVISAGYPWRWHTYANYTNFLSTNELSLGYTEFIEIGAGMDWQINLKPMDWFGWRSLGIRVGYIFGEDLVGYNIGLTAQ